MEFDMAKVAGWVTNNFWRKIDVITAPGYYVLPGGIARIRHIDPSTPQVYAEDFGFSTGATGAVNTQALLDALAAVGEGYVQLPAGTFTVNNTTWTQSGGKLRGMGMPIWNGTTLVGGTILTGGTLLFSGYQRCGVLDMGVIVTAKPAIKSDSGVSEEDGHHLVQNVACKGTDDHGCVFVGHSHNTITNYRAYGFDHGLVLKGKYNKVQGFYSYHPGISCVTLKSDSGAPGDCEYNEISDVLFEGDGTHASFWLDAGAGFHVRYNAISNVILNNGAGGFTVINSSGAASVITGNVISNCLIDSPANNGVWLTDHDSSAGNGPDYNIFADVQVVGAGNYSFSNQYGGSHNHRPGWVSVTPTTADTFGTWRDATSINTAGDITSALTVTAADLVATDDLTVGDDAAISGLMTVGETLDVTGVLTAAGGWKIGHETVTVYDENTWTPVITTAGGGATITYTTQYGQYVRFGNTVFFGFVVVINSLSGGSGDVRISLPVAATANSQLPCACTLSDVDIQTATRSVSFRPVTSQAYGVFREVQDNAAASTIQTTAIASGDTLSGAGFYFV